jgi:3-deoxy-D-manno-octulosonic-acid transferase-like protein
MQSARDSINFLRRRGGIYLNQARRSIWIQARDPEDFEAARPILRWFREAVLADRFLLTSGRQQTCTWLEGRFPSDHALPLPWDTSPLVGRFFHQLHPLMIVCIGESNSLGPIVLRHARNLSVPLVLIDLAAPPPAPMLPYVRLFCVRSSAIAEQIAAMGVAADRIQVTGALRSSRGPCRAPADETGRLTIEALDPMVAELPPPSRAWEMTPVRRNARMHQLARMPLGRSVAANRSKRRLNNWEALRKRLQCPNTILCLGNGPSSEDPRLFDINYDALLRVNHRWLERGMLAEPDMVFVGSPLTTARIRSCVFGFRTIAWESEMMLRHLLLDRSVRRLEYFTYERVSPFLNDGAWPCAPTNGAVMVATAVGLQPRRLILAGIDLFHDARGRYPGDTLGENDYPQMHSRNVDVEILARVLADYHGETVILNEPLREALSARCGSARSTAPSWRPINAMPGLKTF